MHAYYANESPIPPPVIMPLSPMLSPMFDPQDFFLPKEILPPQLSRPPDTSHTRHEERIKDILNNLCELSLDHIEEMKRHVDGQILILCCLVTVYRMAPKRTSTSTSPTMTQAAIRQLVADSVVAALEAQAANMANTDNTNGNTGLRETPVARKCTYKEFMSFQPFYLNGTEGAIGLICWFKRTESVFSCSNCTDDCKVKFATATLTEDSLSWWNSYAKPIGIEQADKIA
nr:reverse transcriptase domain-containing protein [Tanacetum cinerariifolium]